MNQGSTEKTVVFISYSHDNARHERQVSLLADKLKSEFDCRLDAYDDGKVASWPKWMRQQIRDADFVLMIFTYLYRRRFDGDEGTQGRGATWEGNIIQNSLYAATNPNQVKFIPVALDLKALNSIPRDVFSGTSYLLPRDWGRLVCQLHQRRNPQVSQALLRTLSGAVDPIEGSGVPKVLFVGAQKGTCLDLRGQLSKTRQAIAKGKFGNALRIKGVFNLTLGEIVMELNGLSPAILHLSGKQEGGRIKLHDESGNLIPISADHLATLIAEYSVMLKMVILDTCDSFSQAQSIVQTVDFAVGVRSGIAEPVAIDFFAMFYNAIASGHTVQSAYDVAFHLQLARINGDSRYRHEVERILDCRFTSHLHLPKLAVRRGVTHRRRYLYPGNRLTVRLNLQRERQGRLWICPKKVKVEFKGGPPKKKPTRGEGDLPPNSHPLITGVSRLWFCFEIISQPS